MVLGEWFRDREIEQIVSSGMNVGEITRARAYWGFFAGSGYINQSTTMVLCVSHKYKQCSRVKK